MKKQPIHQNLNTSFVNVGALVRYLRGLQFVGSIRIELSSYEADIIFTNSKTITAREYDHIAGRISHGGQTLQRILIRAKEPHGRIHVYKAVGGYAGHDDGSVFVDKAIIAQARELAASHGGTVVTEKGFEIVMNSRDSENALLLAALSEILRMFDDALAFGNLSFASAFQVACDAIASDYSFMASDRRTLVYRDGEIRLNTTAETEDVMSAVFDALRPIFGRLRKEAKYTELVRMLKEKLEETAVERRAEYFRLGVLKHLEALLADE
ncbi:MAG: hypothetical protein ABI646_11350 [Acidobacteriota bacterium]